MEITRLTNLFGSNIMVLRFFDGSLRTNHAWSWLTGENLLTAGEPVNYYATV